MNQRFSLFFFAGAVSVAMSLGACGGIPKLDPQDVTKVMVDSHGGKFCPWGEVKLDLAVVLKDGKMRATNGLDDSVRIDARKNFTYKASAGKIDVRVNGVFFIPPQDYAYLLENDVVAQASLVDRPDLPSASVTFVPDFGCSERVNLGGFDGAGGDGGGGGGGGYSGAIHGGYGGNGGDGERGGDAGPLEVTLGMVDTPKRGKLVIARTVAVATGETDVRLFAPGPGRLHVDDSGGRGGDGGGGGGGGNGGVDNCVVGDGGDGGDGGNGADGGNGGAITIFVDASHPELAQVVNATNGGGAGGLAGGGGGGGNGGYAKVYAPNSNVVICERTGRPGRDGRDGRYRGRMGAPGPRPIVTTIANPFPQGVASVGVRAVSSNTDLSAQGPRVKPAGGTITATGSGHGTVAVGPSGVTVTGTGTANVSGSFGRPPSGAPSAPAMFAQLKGPNLLRIDNKSTSPICEVYPLDQKTKVPVTLSAVTAPLAPGQSRDITRWGPPTPAAAATQVRFGIRTCDGKSEAVAMVPISETTTIVVYNAIPATFPPHSVSAVLARLAP